MTEKQFNDDLVKGLEATERARRNKALLVGGIVAFVGLGGLVLSFAYSDQVFRPELDVASGEKEVITDTNDPQCRGFIADITRVGQEYSALEPQLTDNLLGDDPEKIDALINDLEALKGRIQDARDESMAASLRFENSRGELKEWFRYIDNELTLLQRVGKDRQAELAAVAPDAGTVVEDGKPEKSSKPMPERLSGATLAANEAFQKFRVWHTGGLHPCGAADEGETAWTPPTK